MAHLAHLLLLTLGVMQAPSPVAGRWEGAVEVGGLKLPCAVVFTDSAGGVSATIDIQGARALPLTAVSVDGRKIHFELPTAIGVATFDSTLDGATMAGTFVQGMNRGTFTLARPGTIKVPARVPPPYREEEVTFANGPVTLSGTLTIPEGKGPFPAFVMVTGSGPQNRDEELFGFKVFAVIADYCTRHGIAVLRYDDRGVGGSTGSLATATTADFAGDALAGVALLAGRPELDAARVGVFGHSEGADVAAIAASRSPKVAFIVMMAGTALRGDVVLRHQTEDGARAIGATDEQIAAMLAAHQQVMDAIRTGAGREAQTAAVRALLGAQIQAQPAAARAAMGDPGAFIDKALPGALAQLQNAWMKFFVSFDPAVALAQVKCPVLALFGGKDTQVPPALNKGPLEAALAENKQVTVRVYPDANHLFVKAVTGQVSEYASVEKVFVPSFLDDLVAWLQSVARRAA